LFLFTVLLADANIRAEKHPMPDHFAVVEVQWEVDF